MGTDRHPDAHGSLLAVLVVSTLVLPAVARSALVRDNLYGVKAISATEAWVVGNFGSIYHTTDAGKSWVARESGTKVPLFGIDFAPAGGREGPGGGPGEGPGEGPGVGPGEGWIVGKSALILHTADGGRMWRPQRSVIPPEKHLFYVKAIDARTAWAVGDWGAITVTHDGGETWEDRSLGTITVRVEERPDRVTNTISDDIILYAVSFPDPQHGYIAGEFGTLLATADGGATWERRDLGTEKTLFGVCFSTPETGWAVGIDGLILHTRDAGRTWAVQHGAAQAESIEELGFLETLKNPGLYDVSVAGRYGVVVGDTGNLLTTADGGETWSPRELPEKQRFIWMRGVSLVPGTHGFVVGTAGFAAAIDHDQLVLPHDGARAPQP